MLGYWDHWGCKDFWLTCYCLALPETCSSLPTFRLQNIDIVVYTSFYSEVSLVIPMKQSIFLLNLKWPHGLLCPTKRSRSDGVPSQSPSLKNYSALLFIMVQPLYKYARTNLLKGETPHEPQPHLNGCPSWDL